MTHDEFVGELISRAKHNWTAYWRSLPDEQRLRLAAMEEEITSITQEVQQSLWSLLAEHLDRFAIEEHGQCACGRKREQRQKSFDIEILGLRCEMPCTYLYCRHCKKGVSPVRAWLGLEHGGVSLAFERALTDLTTRMTFGDAADSMKEHHDQYVDRTKAERVTYQVGRDAEIYLKERRKNVREKLRAGNHDEVEQLLFTADGGAIPIGVLDRAKTAKARAKAPKTEVRNLPKGTRTIVGREARFISVHDDKPNAERCVDCHIAPYEQTRFTGERMLAAAAEAGLGDNTKIHGVFDMGKWIHSQFEDQFDAYDRSACADIMHVAEYLVDAGRVLVGPDKAFGWAMGQKDKMLQGEFDDVLKELHRHECDDQCEKSPSGKCLVRVAETYLDNNQHYMRDYQQLIARDLPIGSGEAESGIRHIIKRRMAVAGAWDAANAPLMLALITIRASGWWDDFWRWRDRRDQQAWRDRRDGKIKVTFRGKRRPTNRRKAS